MAPPLLHLDADTSMQALYTTLVARRYDVTRTPQTWMARDATDAEQLLGATAQGRVLFTFNTHDFPALAQQYPQHGGLVLAAQQSWAQTIQGASGVPPCQVSQRSGGVAASVWCL